jgi:hypothetical protein
MWEETGKKGVVYQRIGMQGISYDGSIHPFENEHGEAICMSQYMFDMLLPLLKSQEYIEDFLPYAGEDVDVDFDLIRLQHYTNQPKGSLNRWFNYAFPQNGYRPIKAVGNTSETIKRAMPAYDKVIINFTQRHRNHLINYFFLKKYQDRILFVGLQKERDLFCKTWDLDIPKLDVDNFYDLGQQLKSCKFFRESELLLSVGRINKNSKGIRAFTLMPNVIPIGDKAYDFYHQGAVEYYFEKLLK